MTTIGSSQDIKPLGQLEDKGAGEGGMNSYQCHAKLKTILRVFHGDKDPVTKSDVYLSLKLLHLNSRREQLQV